MGLSPTSSHSNVLLATKSISSAQILAIDVTPVVLVPAQGAGKICIPLFIYGIFTPGTIAYTGANHIKLSWGNVVPDYTSTAFPTGAVTATDPTFSFVCPIGPFAGALSLDVVNVLTTEFANQPIVLYGTGPFAAGNGTATMSVLYALL